MQKSLEDYPAIVTIEKTKIIIKQIEEIFVKFIVMKVKKEQVFFAILKIKKIKKYQYLLPIII